MENRKEQLFRTIVRQHIALGEPIGSKYLLEKSHLDCSPATVRNDMADLEQEGYLSHPHTSAGRVPTEKGWKWFLERFINEQDVPRKAQEALQKASDGASDRQQVIKHLAKTLAESSKQTAIVSFGPDDTFYTGLFNLFSQPEFQERDMVQHISNIVDHLDSVCAKLYDQATDEVVVLVGSDNPVDERCSIMVTRIDDPPDKSGEAGDVTMVALLGPMRMDYDRLLPLLRFTRDLI